MKRKTALLRLMYYLRPHKLRLVIVIISAVISTVFMVLAPYVIGLITTTLFNGVVNTQFDWHTIMALLVILVMLYVISQVFTVIQGQIMVNVTSDIMQTLRRAIDEKMHRLQLNYYDTHTHGDILSVITNDVDIISNTFSQNITSLVTQVTTAIGVLWMMVSISPKLSLIPILIVPLSLVAAVKVMNKSDVYYAKQQTLLGQLNGYVEEIINGYDVVQTFNYQASCMDQFNQYNKELSEVSCQAEVSAGSISPITTLVSDIGYVVCALLGCMGALMGKISIGNVQAMLEYSWRFAEPFSTIASMLSSLSATNAAAKRVFMLLDASEDSMEPLSKAVVPTTKGTVVFDHVSFGYHQNQLLMKDISFHVKAGQKVAIVGPTGAGKTTLVNLLMRFYDICGGAIYVDGVNINQMTREQLREHFAMVLQDTWLFEGTIKENIAYGLDTLDRNVVIQVAKNACAHNFIKTLPNGYDMVLRKGAQNISQGERQLLTIARALAMDPEILILDEATSNVDTHTEALIQQAMQQLMKGRTSFVIAHRLSTIIDADMILYMEQGNIKEMGTHAQLMQKNGKYAALYNAQFA